MIRQRLSFLIAILAASAIQAAPPDFAREVRPILSDACFHCHGPDPATRMMGLRLDLKDAAFTPRKTGAPIVPGDAKASLVYQRIAHENPTRRMPPASSHKTLTPKQIATIKAWIDAGAPWKEHWAFVPPSKPKPPAVINAAWPKTPIDRFILAALEKQGLTPAPPADRRTLARRLSLDITGLPPSPQDVEAFVRDLSPNAYEKLIDKFMASPRWGEHRGRYWLDAARYADTHGLHIDNFREMWPYRDWVIRAFNRNQPFHQFTIEQLAGDLLPEPTMDQLIATGFQRCNVTTNEGGVIPEEVAAMYAKDRADTTGAVFLGLTVGCATCHDHKFDPITQKDFYSLTAFYRNTIQDPLDGNISDTPPVIVVPRDEDRPRWQQLSEHETRLIARRETVRKASLPDFGRWLDGDARRKLASPLEPADELLALNPGALTVRNQPKPFPDSEGLKTGPAHLPEIRALYFAEKSQLELENFAAFEAIRPFTVSAWIYVPKKSDNYTIVSQLDPQSRGRGLALELNGRTPALKLTTQPNKTFTIRAGPLDRLQPERWYHLAASYDGTRRLPGIDFYIDGKLIAAEGRNDRTPLPGDFKTYAPLRIASDGRGRFFNGGALADLRILTRAVTPEEVNLLRAWPVIESARTKDTKTLTEAEREAFHAWYLHREYSNFMNVSDEIRAVREERRDIAFRGAVTHVQQERTDQKPFAHVLYRGAYDQLRDKVEPAAPSALPPMPEGLPRNRLGLAQWLVSDSNPLTARVTVNRFWQEVFGTGLVRTSEDFGSQGQPPVHPELLDWLAVDFRENNWDVKRFFKQIFLSAAYRQSAAATPLKLEKDPENLLLSRGPRFRMDAEVVRDSALAVSGLLNPRIGGASVKPYQPDGLWETVAMPVSDTRFYVRDAGDKLYRRSMYTFWKRSAPPASMDIFNAPSRENCTVRRERTNTPLQALVTLNDVQFFEAARALAQAALSEAATLDKQLDHMTTRVLARLFDLKERAVIKKAHADFLAQYKANPAQAKDAINVGESAPDPTLDPAQLAALTMVANSILNLDEAVNK
ncbi:MAG: DUF1553 domain-containing protein [Bryobacteraceae bacterium]|nr:DUF1553 domain-containing protein [Bryobacteraceae bacterium]